MESGCLELEGLSGCVSGVLAFCFLLLVFCFLLCALHFVLLLRVTSWESSIPIIPNCMLL
jgi:hypothetical protein